MSRPISIKLSWQYEQAYIMSQAYVCILPGFGEISPVSHDNFRKFDFFVGKILRDV